MWEITCWRATFPETANSGVMLSEKGCPATGLCSLTRFPVKGGGCSCCLPCPLWPAQGHLWGTEAAQPPATLCSWLRPEPGLERMKPLLTSILWAACGLDKICVTLVSSFRFGGAWNLLLTSLSAALALCSQMLTHSLWPTSLWNVFVYCSFGTLMTLFRTWAKVSRPAQRNITFHRRGGKCCIHPFPAKPEVTGSFSTLKWVLQCWSSWSSMNLGLIYS